MQQRDSALSLGVLLLIVTVAILVFWQTKPPGQYRRQPLSLTSSRTVAEKPPKPVLTQWEPVKNLKYIEGTWVNSKGGTIQVESRDTANTRGQAWTLPYPYRARFHADESWRDNPYDCGFFSTIEDPSGWRVAFCRGGGLDPVGGRHALRLTLELNHAEQEEGLLLTVGSVVSMSAFRGRP